MIYIFCALYREAAPLIRALSLKRNTERTVFQYFGGEGILLCLTGPGPCHAAAAVGYTFALEGAPSSCQLINFGSAGSSDPSAQGRLFLGSVLTDTDAGWSCYPDLFADTSLPEARILTAAAPWDGAEPEISDPAVSGSGTAVMLHDMEAAAIFEAAGHFLGPHQLHFLKYVSDAGSPGRVTPERLQEGAERVLPEVLRYLDAVKALNETGAEPLSGGNASGEEARAGKEVRTGKAVLEQEVLRLAQELHASAAMREELSHLLVYADLAGIGWQEEIRAMRARGLLPARDRKEGKKCLAALSSGIRGLTDL